MELINELVCARDNVKKKQILLPAQEAERPGECCLVSGWAVENIGKEISEQGGGLGFIGSMGHSHSSWYVSSSH